MSTAYPRKRSARTKKRGERERQRGGGGSYCKARQNGKTGFSLMDHWTSTTHPAGILFMPHSLMPSLRDWTFYLYFSSLLFHSTFTLIFPSLFSLWLDLPGFINSPVGEKLFMFARAQKKISLNLHHLQKSVELFPVKPRASFSARVAERGEEDWAGLCPLSGLILSVVMGFIVLKAEEQKYRAGREGVLLLQSPHTHQQRLRSGSHLSY